AQPLGSGWTLKSLLAWYFAKAMSYEIKCEAAPHAKPLRSNRPKRPSIMTSSGTAGRPVDPAGHRADLAGHRADLAGRPFGPADHHVGLAGRPADTSILFSCHCFVLPFLSR